MQNVKVGEFGPPNYWSWNVESVILKYPCENIETRVQFFPIPIPWPGMGRLGLFQSSLIQNFLFIECGQEHEIRFRENINRISNFRPCPWFPDWPSKQHFSNKSFLNNVNSASHIVCKIRIWNLFRGSFNSPWVIISKSNVCYVIVYLKHLLKAKLNGSAFN